MEEGVGERTVTTKVHGTQYCQNHTWASRQTGDGVCTKKKKKSLRRAGKRASGVLVFAAIITGLKCSYLEHTHKNGERGKPLLVGFSNYYFFFLLISILAPQTRCARRAFLPVSDLFTGRRAKKRQGRSLPLPLPLLLRPAVVFF